MDLWIDACMRAEQHSPASHAQIEALSCISTEIGLVFQCAIPANTFLMRHKVEAVLLVPFRRPQLQPSTLQALNNAPCHSNRPGSADQYGQHLDEQQLKPSAKEKTEAVDQAGTCMCVRAAAAGEHAGRA